MKILYITNICNIGPILVEEAAYGGIEAHFVEYPWAFRKFTNFFKFLSFLMRYKFLDFDVYHYNWPIASLLPMNKDISYLKKKGKIIVAHYHGSDIRYREEKDILKNIERKIISTPDLQERLPDAEWIPFPINLRDMKKRKTWNDIPTIIHAPSDREKKGTFYILKSIKKLKEKYNFNFELIEKKPNSYVIERMKKADIVIDHIGTRPEWAPPWYGKVSLEALYSGAIPCFYVRPDLEQYISERFYINITEGNLIQQLSRAIEDENLRSQLRKRGYHYLKKIHDSRKIMKKLINLYNR